MNKEIKYMLYYTFPILYNANLINIEYIFFIYIFFIIHIEYIRYYFAKK